MLEELKNKMELAVSERLNNPIIYSFIISWSIINYEFIMVLLSNNSVTVTINLIDTLIWPTSFDLVLKCFISPLIAVAVYVYLLPIPTKWVYSHRLRTANNLRKIKTHIEGEQVLTLSESKVLKERLLEIEVSKDREIEELREQLNRYKELYKTSLTVPDAKALELSPEYADFSKVKPTPDVLDDAKWLLFLNDYDQKQVKKTLRRLCQVDEISSDEYTDLNSSSYLDNEAIDELVSRGLLKRVRFANSATISITNAGRTFHQYLSSGHAFMDSNES